MCHYALPSRFERHDDRLPPRFADDCMTSFEQSAKRHNTPLSKFQAKIFGGGNMCEKQPVTEDSLVSLRPVGEKNVEAAFELLSQLSVPIHVAHVGDFANAA
ncbi:CheD chemotactic sensory transduction [Marinomonas fungiae]|uniref:CheD chemotactic sensory transduction n=2 Tax=Marinomonas fungiae TaxID=1137284 RepID=A0A0K6IUC2_9GAMM|nr:CheD chemotactic sensory transduction [Marinomonas fungiae]